MPSAVDVLRQLRQPEPGLFRFALGGAKGDDAVVAPADGVHDSFLENDLRVRVVFAEPEEGRVIAPHDLDGFVGRRSVSAIEPGGLAGGAPAEQQQDQNEGRTFQDILARKMNLDPDRLLFGCCRPGVSREAAWRQTNNRRSA